ncbi:hypothetical protein [Bacillus anthracis]|uniref:hypothetical protein n=1 Tax=Bacillus anthracis TaxID=1392 RepID=UPI002DB9FF26|nr:hypothetical protein [Bacillus anthracis]MEB9458423.1 hypothetical protein [Bacillus anthracis]
MYSFIIAIFQKQIMVYEKQSGTQFKQISLFGETSYKIKDVQFQKAGENIYSEMIDIYNLRNLQNAQIHIVYEHATPAQIGAFSSPFYESEELQQLHLKNVLSLSAILSKKLKGFDQLIVVSVEKMNYLIHLDKDGNFIVKETSQQATVSYKFEELLLYTNVIGS